MNSDHDDEDETLTIKEARNALRTLDIDLKKDEIRSWTSTNADGERQNTMNRDQFVRMATSKVIQKEKADRAFALFDKDGKGVIVMQDLQRAVADLEEDMSTEELEEMIGEADKGGDGLFSKEDFYRIVRKINL